MTTGEKIKEIRKQKGLSRKQLAYMCGMSDFTIRGYELGSRAPSLKQLEKIAAALGINTLAISNINIDTYVGVAHNLFQLEEQYGITVTRKNGSLCLTSNNSSIVNFLSGWNSMKEKLAAGEITQEEYDMWRYNYPTSSAQLFQKELSELRKQKKENQNSDDE